MAKKKREERKDARASRKAEKEQVKAVDSKVDDMLDSRKESKKSVPSKKSTGRKFQEEMRSVKKSQDNIRSMAGEKPEAISLSSILKKPIEKEENVVPNVSGKEVKSEVTSNIIDKTDSYNEAVKANELGEVVKSATDETVKDIDKEGEKVEGALKTQVNKETEEPTRTVAEGYSNMEGSALKAQAEAGQGQYDMNNMSDEDFAIARAEYMEQMSRDKADAPSAAIEALGIQHYYPPQQDYVTSNFTGRYIGSRQLISAPDALYPEGLVDARKRAVEAKAKAKAQSQDKYWELMDTAPQYDEAYKDIGMDMIDKYGDASGWDFASLEASNTKLGKQFRRDMYDFKSRGKYLLDLNSQVNTMVEKWTDGDEYTPPEIKKMMMDFRTATSDLDAYMKGEAIGDEKVKAMSNMFRSYQNFTPLMNKQLERMASLGAEELPLAAGTNFNDPTFAANAESAIAKSGDLNWDKYTTVMSKYFDLDKAKDIVEGIYSHNSLWEGMNASDREKILNSSTRTFISHLPTKVDIETKFQDTKALGWAQLRNKKYEFERQSEWKEKEWYNLYDAINMESTEIESGAVSAVNSAMTPEAKAGNLRDYYAKNGKTPTMLGDVVGAKIPTEGTSLHPAKSNDLLVVNDRDKLVPIADYAKDVKKRLDKDPSNKELKEIYKGLNQVLSSPTVEHRVEERVSAFAQYDQGIGSFTPIEKSKTATVENSTNIVYRAGKVGVSTGVVKNGKEEVSVPNLKFVVVDNIESESNRRVLSDDEGSQESRNRYYKETGQTTGTSSSRGSGGN